MAVAEPLAKLSRELGKRGAKTDHPCRVQLQRGQVGLGKVAVVLHLLLGAQRRERAGDGVEVQRLQGHLLPARQDLALALDLGANAPFQKAERIHVLELRLDAQLAAAGAAQRDVCVAAQRALLHPHVAHAQLTQRRAQQLQPLAHLLGRAQVGLGHDLRQRRAAAVEVHDAQVRAVNAPAGADVAELGCVLLQVHALDAHLAETASAAEGLVVLGYLVALGQVRIEVVLAVEDRARRELGAQREADHQPEVHSALVCDRQGAGKPEADGAGARVGRLAEGNLAAAEHLCARRQLHVDLESDHRLERAAGGFPRLRHGPHRSRSRAPPRARGRRRAGGSR